MIKIKCTSCGASEFKEEAGIRICLYCGSRFKLENTTSIDLNDDVSRLLEKCKSDPRNAKRYANLILDIDPTNKAVLKYL